MFRFRRKPSDMGDTEKPALKEANDNPWYCLATVHGEQPIDRLDQELAQRNRLAFERWINGSMSPDQEKELASQFSHRTSLKLPVPNTPPDFSNTRFDRPVDFSSVTFKRPADFRSSTFSGDVNFGGTRFENQADFSSAIFSGEAKFERVQFQAGSADFKSARFSKGVDFQYATFSNANFRSTTFSGPANFNSTTFHGIGRATFNSAVFSDGADFGSANFLLGGVDFGSADFSKTASFNAAKFNMATFEAATFSSLIQFINAEFNGSTIFASARFEAQPPDFRGATMHEATEWHDVTWPKPPKNDADAQQQVYAYERLKQEMERLKKHEDEQNFFRRELRARRRLLRTSPGEWLLNFLYQLFSDYGKSFRRPLFWLLAIFAAGTAFFALSPVYCGTPMPFELAARLSFANIFLFLPDKREIMMDHRIADCLSNTMLVSAAQSLLSVVLLFLLGLALRNRFRMR
jgi:uncharacterized protein YjbI with pentapeptide repeats